MGNIRVRGALVGVAVAMIGAFGLALPAGAAPGGTGHTVTDTELVHGSFTDTEATNPCTGAPGVANFDGTMLMHVTYFPGGDEAWGTFTETGKVSVTWVGVTYSGHATAWGNFNVNNKNANETFTFSLRLSAPNGASVSGHEVAHFGTNANGDVTVSFDKMSFTCD